MKKDRVQRPWMPIYWEDYDEDTRHLFNDEHGAYLMLIRAYWRAGRPLPDDDRVLYRAAACRTIVGWRRLRPAIEPFFTITDGMWRHKRIDAELAEAEQRIASRAHISSLGGRASVKARVERPKPLKRNDPGSAVGSTDGATDGRTAGQHNNKDNNKIPLANTETEPARAIAKAFLELREKHFPTESALPAPTNTLTTQAQQYLDLGATPALIVEVMERVMAKEAAGGGVSAPNSLRFCRLTMEREARKFTAAPSSGGGASGTHSAADALPRYGEDPVTWRWRIRKFRESKFWSRMWGPNPDEPGCMAPKEILAEVTA
jgi:uncharacterized protein YdaU (DUF1376 family)